jgi:hypothetical protein
MVYEFELTDHASARCRQRGIRDVDVNLLMRVASPVGRDQYLLKDQDAALAIRQRKQEIQALERLRGCKFVVEADLIITCMHATRATQKQSMRYGRQTR